MNANDENTLGLFPALLKYWRHSRGLSQLDLGLAANVSARHISFLETGRANPSREMVLTLGATLEIPLREQNTLLSAAGFHPAFEETPIGMDSQGPIDRVLDRMLKKHEPYPMVVMDSGYNLIRSNPTAQHLIQHFIANPSAIRTPLNLYEMLFDPDMTRPFVANWESLGHQLLARVNRECLLRPHNKRLTKLMDKLLEYPDVPESWRVPDFSRTSEPFLTLQLQRDNWRLNFLTIITSFNAPQNITAQELLIETLFPVDDDTEQACANLMSA